MSRADLMSSTGAAISATGTPEFPAAITGLLRGIAPYSYTVAFGYRGASRPIDLYEDFPHEKRKVFVTEYQAGAYLLDPFFLAASQPVVADLYRLRDLAPDRFYQGEYFRNYYVRTGLADEIGYFVNLPGGAMVVLSLMRAEKPFSGRNLQDLRELCPIVEACLRRHWAGLSDRMDAAAHVSAIQTPVTRIEHSFHIFGAGVLTPRERQIVEHTLKGHSAEAVGRILEISPGTVRIHRRNIYAKLRISSQGELFSKFIQTLGME